MAMIMFYFHLQYVPDWLKTVFTHHYTPKEMTIVALVGLLLGMVYGWWVKKRLGNSQNSKARKD